MEIVQTGFRVILPVAVAKLHCALRVAKGIVGVIVCKFGAVVGITT